LKKYEHKKEAVKELRKAYLDDKRRAIESREDVNYFLLDIDENSKKRKRACGLRIFR
jgi:hypothetical protein